MTKKYLTLLASSIVATSLLVATPASAANLSFGDEFNFIHKDGINFQSLNHNNFYKSLIPVAKSHGEVNFYNFAAGSFPNMFKKVIPAFEKAYGIKVNLYTVKNDLAMQQMIATKHAGQDAPADLFFIPDPNLTSLMQNDLMGNIDLYNLLPTTQKGIKHRKETFGIHHGGAYVDYHANQVALGYNSAMIRKKHVPTSYAGLLKYAKQHPRAVAITSPIRGGSGIGFLIGVAQANLKSHSCKAGWSKKYADVATASSWVKNSGCMDATWKYMRELYKNVKFTNGNADTLSLISNGVVKIGTVWEDMVYGEINRGAANPAIRMSLVKDGMPGTYNGMVLLSNGKNVAGALLLLDYFMSNKAQLAKLTMMASRSPKAELSMRHIPRSKLDLLVPANQFKNYHIGWSSVEMEKALKENFIEQVIEKVGN